jgi:hypothetical protein
MIRNNCFFPVEQFLRISLNSLCNLLDQASEFSYKLPVHSPALPLITTLDFLRNVYPFLLKKAVNQPGNSFISPWMF